MLIAVRFQWPYSAYKPHVRILYGGVATGYHYRATLDGPGSCFKVGPGKFLNKLRILVAAPEMAHVN